MRLILVLLFAMTFQSAMSQGYRGRRYSFSYQPAYSFVNYLLVENLIPIVHHKANLGIALGKSFSINLNAQYSHGKKEDYFKNGVYTTYSGPLEVQYFAGDMEAKDLVVGLQLNYFRVSKQAYAPIGRYFSVGFEYGTTNSYREERKVEPMNWNKDVIKIYPFYDDLIRKPLMLLSFYTGRNFLIKECFLIGYGIQFGFQLNKGDNEFARHIGKPFLNLGIIF